MKKNIAMEQPPYETKKSLDSEEGGGEARGGTFRCLKLN